MKVFKIRPCVCGSSSGLTLELSICSVCVALKRRDGQELRRVFA